jgi:hypothetical protein
VGIFGGLTGVVFLPRLARIPEERLWRWRALQFGGLLAAVAATLLAAAWLAPAQLLWILGEQYQGLHRELLLVVATAACGLVGGYVVNLNLSRSWTRLQPLTLAVEVLCLVGLIAWLPLDSTSGVLRLGLLAVTAGVAMQLAVALLGVTRPRLVAWHP